MATVLLERLVDAVSGCFSGSFRCLGVFSRVDAWHPTIPGDGIFDPFMKGLTEGA